MMMRSDNGRKKGQIAKDIHFEKYFLCQYYVGRGDVVSQNGLLWPSFSKECKKIDRVRLRNVARV